MEGAYRFLAALLLAQAISFALPRWLWQIRLSVAALLAVTTVLPVAGALAAFLGVVLPVLVWLPLHRAAAALRREWQRLLASETAYVTVAVVSLVIWRADARGFMAALLRDLSQPVVLAIAAVYILAIFGGARVIRLAIAPFLHDLPPADQSALPRAGRVIGWIERFVVMTLIAAGYGEPVGWLLAAKTAMRYPEIKGEATGRLGEYFLVGTLLSISIGIAAGLAVRWLLALPR